jgi:hypothetical protein
METKWLIAISLVLVFIIMYGVARQGHIKYLLSVFRSVNQEHNTDEDTDEDDEDDEELDELDGGGRKGRKRIKGKGMSKGHKSRPYKKGVRPMKYHYGYRYKTRSWWPYWTRFSHWWPNYDDCLNYAHSRCIGASNYGSCYDYEYHNCPYRYY